MINRGVDRLVTVGPFDPSARDYLQRHARHPVSFVDTLPAADRLAGALLFVSDTNDDAAATDSAFEQGHLNMVRERDLVARFQL